MATPTSRRNSRTAPVAAAFAACMIAGACAATPEAAPQIDPTHVRAVAVVGYVRSSSYYAEEPCAAERADDGTELVCISLDPPPLRLVLEIEEVLSGERVPSRVVAVTGAHFGLARYPAGPEHRSMYVLWTDGATYGIPRYATLPVVRTAAGKWVIPRWQADDSPWMLPCEAGERTIAIDFRGSSARERFSRDPSLWERELRENPSLVRRGDWVYPTLGIPLEAVRAALALHPLTPEREQCSR